MKIVRSGLCYATMMLFLLAGCVNQQQSKVLIYTKNGEGFVHDNIQASVDMLKTLLDDQGIAYDISDQAMVFSSNNLEQYNALIFSNTNNEAFDNEEQRMAFQSYIQSGGGFVGIHSACGSERDWPWYWQMLGGTFVRHPKYQSFTINVIDSDHPSTSFLDGDWDWEDEAYYLDHLNPDIHVLLAHDMSTIEDPGKDEFPGKVFGDLFPSAWCHEFDGGREWYTSYGHNIKHYSDINFQKHVLGGILWTIGQDH